MKKRSALKFFLFLFLIFNISGVIADDIVVEILISTTDNQAWNPHKSMHLTIAHLKNIEGATIQNAINDFNKKNEKMLQQLLLPGFIVEEFNHNGFERGFHILLENEKNAKRLEKLNDKLYQYLSKNYKVHFTDITSPKYIYPKGFVPHIEFIERDKIPSKGTTLYFASLKLTTRIINFDRK